MSELAGDTTRDNTWFWFLGRNHADELSREILRRDFLDGQN
jgi:hypothetical protein